MPRKKSIKLAAQTFQRSCTAISAYLREARTKLNDKHVSWSYEYAIIRLYREFEELILNVLIGAINNDSSTISATTGYQFPTHLTDEICQYLVIGTGYFDFKGRDGLIRTLRRYVPAKHYLVRIIRDPAYINSLEQLSALRNYVTHNSEVSKKAALKATNQTKISSGGSWLMRKKRYEEIADCLKRIVRRIHNCAPY